MKNDLIQKHLLNRYLNGYKIEDPTYEKIIELSVKQLPTQITTLELVLKELLGEVSIINLQLYQEIAKKVLKKRSHRNPTIYQIYKIIDGHNL